MNLLSIGISVIPLLILLTQTIDNKYAFKDILYIIGLLFYLGLIPIVFISQIVRFFTLIEVLLIIFISFVYLSLLVSHYKYCLLEESKIIESKVVFFFEINYLVLFFYVIYKFTQQKYNHNDMRLALSLVLFTPWFIGMIYLFNNKEFNNNN